MYHLHISCFGKQNLQNMFIISEYMNFLVFFRLYLENWILCKWQKFLAEYWLTEQFQW